MRKKSFIFACLVLLAFVLGGCGKGSSNNKELNNYKEAMETFFTGLEEADSTIKAINPDDQNAMNNLLSSFDDLEKKFSDMAALEVPTENVPETFSLIKELAVGASDYMTEANGYMHDSFSESSYNEHTLSAAMECYKRANKRVQFIISLLHGEYPQDESITYNE